MRISLVYNEKAGSGLSAEELEQEIEAAGHRVVGMLEPGAEMAKALDDSTELVVVAGGDGTVQQVATGLAGRRIPLAILPLGTANNIASSLGIEGSIDELVAGWEHAPRLPLDLGLATAPWGQRRFIESTGSGLVAKGIVVMDGEAPHAEADDPDDMIAKSLRRFRDVLAELVARPCKLTLDGSTRDTELLLVEVLNIRSVGPGLLLAPDADPADGLFDVVTAGEAERPELERYLEDRLRERPATLRLPRQRASRVELHNCELIHLDDWVHPEVGGETVTLGVERAAIEVLMQRPTRA